MACITRIITGNIEEWGTGNSYFTVFLRSNGRVLDSFDMTMENQEILTELREDMLVLLGISNNTQCYLELISELGLELPKPWHKYWKPYNLKHEPTKSRIAGPGAFYTGGDHPCYFLEPDR